MINLAKVKLVVTDMDGTLLNTNHEVSALFFDLFEKIKAHNILFAAASGRPVYGILDKLNAIKDDMIIVAENGGLVIQNDQVLLSTAFQKSSLMYLNTMLENIPEANVLYCTRNKAYTNSKSKKLLQLLNEFYKDYGVVDSIDDIDAPIYKIALYHEISSEKYLYPHLKHLEDRFKVKVSANHWVDLSENNANKGHAVQLIQKLHNISKEETLVFGDYKNDIEMLNSAYFSYAMENAHPEVKETANFITKSNNELGVESILQLLVNKKEKQARL